MIKRKESVQINREDQSGKLKIIDSNQRYSEAQSSKFIKDPNTNKYVKL